MYCLLVWVRSICWAELCGTGLASSIYDLKLSPSPGEARSSPCLAGGAGDLSDQFLDNFFTGCKENVLHLIGMSNFEMVRHDIMERILLEVDQIYHLACPASPIHYK